MTIVASLTVLLLPTQAACASCIHDPRPLPVEVAEADIVFVGTVITVADGGRDARIQVEEIWKGPELGEQVVVHGGPEGASITSVDRHWQPGARYLVFPRRQGARLEDDACSPTIRWEPPLAAFRPDRPHLLEPGSEDPASGRVTALVFLSGAVLALVLAIGWLVRRSM
ncbi:MAG: hypothetical protein M3133_05370 [Actinomycetota bacterium]|nr:hypothetical protein [Actinomycetota bacterium]